jgi:hypothetical protein
VDADRLLMTRRKKAQLATLYGAIWAIVLWDANDDAKALLPTHEALDTPQVTGITASICSSIQR